MRKPAKQSSKASLKKDRTKFDLNREAVKQVSEKARDAFSSAKTVVVSAKKKFLTARGTAASWADTQMPRVYGLLEKTVSCSKTISSAAKMAFLESVMAAYEVSIKSGRKGLNHSAIFLNALLASDFRENLEAWLGATFNEGVPSIYDKAVDAIYNATHVGGGHLHRLFDGSHTPTEMWEKVREASPDDTTLQEVIGYATALGKDLSSSVGIPLFDLSKSSYDQVAGALNTTFEIPKSWFADLLHVNATELIGTTIGTIAVTLNWNKKQIREFATLAGSLGISSMASANPALAIVALVALAKSFVDARQSGDYSTFVKGLAKGGVGTGAFLATSSAVGGPVWVGLLAAMCVGAVVHRSIDAVAISEIAAFVEKSLTKATGQLQAANHI